MLTEVAVKNSSGSLFQDETTRWLKYADRATVRFPCTAILYWWPLKLYVLLLLLKNSYLSTYSLSVIILKVSIRSPLDRLFSNVVNCSLHNLDFWAHQPTSLLVFVPAPDNQYPFWGRPILSELGRHRHSSRVVKSLIQTWICSKQMAGFRWCCFLILRLHYTSRLTTYKTDHLKSSLTLLV